jgi:hypothetical protein
MNKPSARAGTNSLDRIRKVQPSLDGDRSDRQNLADTMSSPERAHLLLTPPTESDRMGMGPVDEDAVTPLSRPASARASDPGRIGQSGWFQRSDIHDGIPQERLAPRSTLSPALVALAVGAALVVGLIGMGSAVLWLLY